MIMHDYSCQEWALRVCLLATFMSTGNENPAVQPYVRSASYKICVETACNLQ